ncbi:MAG TPA: serine hydrolase domain-containing protein [Trebonia sp.]|jgi:CubicO group peptidase (beta-lactamase class C family)|nr:serine hydrolase domain-containing protein [Trebonia sp.]
MSDQPRPLPGQPSLRYLKLEARRRLAAGEFATLHDAQLAIAREHGQPSWTALKQLIESRLETLGRQALTQLRWVISRFGGADEPGWSAPADGELSEHFTDRFLGSEKARTMVTVLSRVAARLREELVVTQDDPLNARARVGGIQFEADAEAGPPHRLHDFRAYPVGSRVTDARVAAPPTSSSGAVPAAAAEAAARGFDELGLTGVVLAGGAPDGAGWVIARDWADLDRAEPLRPGHRFPAYGVTRLTTATAVLRLVAEGRVRLDVPANDHLRAVRLADGAVTVRELLSYAGGVDTPAPGSEYADTVPTLASLFGPVLPCSGPRGTARPGGHGDYAALGQLIADVTGSDYAEAVARLVLGPLGMTGSTFPASWPHDDPDAVTGYELEPDGTFLPGLDDVATMPAAAGLWTTAADLVTFGTEWSSLLPDGLAGEALRPQAAEETGPGQAGLGWRLNTARGFAYQVGVGPGGSSSLIVKPGVSSAYVALTNRKVNIAPLNVRVFLQDS